MIVLGVWIVFTFRMLKKRQSKIEEEVKQPSICYDVEEVKHPIEEEAKQPSICYDVVQCQEEESQISR